MGFGEHAEGKPTLRPDENVKSQLTDLQMRIVSVRLRGSGRDRAYAYISPSAVDEEADIVPAIITRNGKAGRILRKEARQGELKVPCKYGLEHSDELENPLLTRERKRA